jgi:hypothetical protein
MKVINESVIDLFRMGNGFQYVIRREVNYNQVLRRVILLINIMEMLFIWFSSSFSYAFAPFQG